MGFSPEFLVMGAMGAASFGLLALGVARSRQHARLTRRLQALSLQRGVLQGPVHGGLAALENLLLPGRGDAEEVQIQLRSAGFTQSAAPVVFGLLRLSGALLLAILAALLAWQMEWLEGAGRTIPFAGFVAGFLGAKMVLGMLFAARLRQVRRELPFMLDLLVLMLESGIGLDQCFRQLAQLESGGMQVIRLVNIQLVDDLQNGMSYESALERWSQRLALPGASELASLFRQSLLHGTELGPALLIFVREFSDKRVSMARDAIGRKTAQMTVVMILFLMPALFIVLAGPAVVSIGAALGGIIP